MEKDTSIVWRRVKNKDMARKIVESYTLSDTLFQVKGINGKVQDALQKFITHKILKDELTDVELDMSVTNLHGYSVDSAKGIVTEVTIICFVSGSEDSDVVGKDLKKKFGSYSDLEYSDDENVWYVYIDNTDDIAEFFQDMKKHGFDSADKMVEEVYLEDIKADQEELEQEWKSEDIEQNREYWRSR